MTSKGHWSFFIAILVLAILVIYGTPPPPRETAKPLPTESNISTPPHPPKNERQSLPASSQIKQAKPDVVLLFDGNAGKITGTQWLLTPSPVPEPNLSSTNPWKGGKHRP